MVAHHLHNVEPGTLLRSSIGDIGLYPGGCIVHSPFFLACSPSVAIVIV